ncbi:MAG: helix-turn-helix domain-containing protein [Gammaproteobacteria bacterium]|nr:helix-turn-helix domain-containing protein [Gammaproteobacteria bacterium]
MSYHHLSLSERHYIETERKLGTSINKIAQTLGRSQSSLSRELHRNIGHRGYRHQQANKRDQERHQSKTKAAKLTALPFFKWVIFSDVCQWDINPTHPNESRSLPYIVHDF